jgi:hypothetical protein
LKLLEAFRIMDAYSVLMRCHSQETMVDLIVSSFEVAC